MLNRTDHAYWNYIDLRCLLGYRLSPNVILSAFARSLQSSFTKFFRESFSTAAIEPLEHLPSPRLRTALHQEGKLNRIIETHAFCHGAELPSPHSLTGTIFVADLELAFPMLLELAKFVWFVPVIVFLES
jgi:hypothetical protein